MVIPKSFKVGKCRYIVKCWVTRPVAPVRGSTQYSVRRVDIETQSSLGRRYSLREQQETFWHEALHTCFFDMGTPTNKHDETLIDALAKCITQICNTAET